MKKQFTERDSAALAAKLFPNAEAAADVVARYPSRRLSPDAAVTRIAPSPTGSMHIGGVYMAVVSKFLAARTGGVFFLRIEDTDKKREAEGAVATIISTLDKMGLTPDEGPLLGGGERGEYGPYTQSERTAIYGAFARRLVEKGWAYPCFASEEDLAAMRSAQEAQKVRPGYYGTWATWRDADVAEVGAALAANTPWVLRLRSRGDGDSQQPHDDLIRQTLLLPQNDQDAVLLKRDGTPTYHLAHAVDDHLMGTTHVIRADEWVSSLPLHRELFAALEFPEPRYAHVAPIQKLDNGNRRKLSKRHDPEAGFGYYDAKGYPPRAIVEYLLNLANPNFEDWRRDNPDAPAEEFPLALSAFNRSSPLFDEVKLRDVAKSVVARMSASEVYAAGLAWSLEHAADFAALLSRDPGYSIEMLSIERGGEKVRRDIAAWSDLPLEFSYFFDETFVPAEPAAASSNLSAQETAEILRNPEVLYDPARTRDDWFDGVKRLAASLGFATSLKEYKADKGKYRGQVGDLTQVLRLAVTGRTRTPDLYEVMRVLGVDRSRGRLISFANKLQAATAG